MPTRDTNFTTTINGSDPSKPGRTLLSTSERVIQPNPSRDPVAIQTIISNRVVNKQQVGSGLVDFKAQLGATLLVRKRNGDTLVAGFDRLVLANTTEPEREKASPVYTHGAAVTYTNGRAPQIYSYVGALLDDPNEGPSLARWIEMYENFFRGSVAAAQDVEVELYYLFQHRRGVLLTHNVERDASSPSNATLGFSMWVGRGN